MGRAGDEPHARVIAHSESAPVAISAIAWQPGGDLNLGEWAQHGKRLGAISRGVAWWIGDWVNYGNAKFGEKYVRAAHITGYDVKSLMNMASVAGKFELSRRRENLSWSHHAEVAGLSPEIGDQWLVIAEAGRMSVHGLREELRAWRARIKREATGRPPKPGNPENSAENSGENSIEDRVENSGENSGENGLRSDVGGPGGVSEATVDVPGHQLGEGAVTETVARCPQCGYELGATPGSVA